MAVSDLTGKVKVMAKKASSPWAILTTISTMMVTMIWGGQYVIADMKAANVKADSALVTAEKMEAKLDLLIQMQMLQMQASKVNVPQEVIVASRNPRRIIIDTIPETVFVAPPDTTEDSL